MSTDRRRDDHAFTLLMDKLDGMDKKLDGLTGMVNKHEVEIQQAKFVAKVAHFVGWPALAAGVHNVWKHLNQ